jgi:aminoglycoside phosphotransferase (APT) family kinase protein
VSVSRDAVPAALPQNGPVHPSPSEPVPSVPGPAELADLAGLAVRDALGSAVAVEAVQTLQAGPDSVVALLALRGSPEGLVLKLARPADRAATDLERTAAVMSRVRQAGVPTAAVLAADADGRLGGWQHLLQEHVVGRVWREVRPLLPERQLWSAHEQIATALLALRSVRPGGFGELDRHGAAIPVPPAVALRQRVRLRVRGPDARTLAEQLLERYHSVLDEASQPVLCHDDLHHQNLVFRSDAEGCRLVGVLDWDKAWAGPADSDLARLAFWDDMTGPSFWSVYRAAVPAVDGEDERLLVHQLLWCLEYDVPSERHRADTAALVRRLGLP